MQYRKVVSLAACKELLAKWVGVRNELTAGATGFMVCVRHGDGSETVEMCGCYENSKDDALKASLRMSWEATRRSGVSAP